MKEVALPQTWEICGFAPNVRNRWLCPTYFAVHSSVTWDLKWKIKSLLPKQGE